MMTRTCYFFVLLSGLAGAEVWAGGDPTRLLEPDKLPDDRRLTKQKTLNDYFPFTPPESLDAWNKRKQIVRERVLVATGLWPMPEKTSAKAVIHGKIDRDTYTIEKVYFASYPGHYVSGNLYRPKGRQGKVPGVLCPHGHWPNGRFFDALAVYGEKRIQEQLSKGAEKTAAGARYPLQARCAHLARMGCTVFHYDMVGYADSQIIKHSSGFTDAEAELRAQSFMGLQTYNSVRSLDFLLSLPEVDATRIGVTGASGGGTQTFILGAIDDRPTAAFPAVMVSTGMQGGCICENCSGLRQDTGNIELAGLFAPRPLGMTGADDWTKEIMTKGLPELKALYKLHGHEDRVMAQAFLQFDHNYNQVSREVMYDWFNKHLNLGHSSPVKETPFDPVPIKDLSVYDAKHPVPADAQDVAGLRRTLTTQSSRQLESLFPRDNKGLREFQRVVGTALAAAVGDSLPTVDEVEAREEREAEESNGLRWRKYILTRKGEHEAIPAFGVIGSQFNGDAVVWIDPRGKSSLFDGDKLVPAAQQLIDRGAGILAVDVFLTGEYGKAPAPKVAGNYAGYTYGYNRSLLANRVHDILTAVAFARKHPRTKTVHLVGFDDAGPWVLLARALCGDTVARTAADWNRFDFAGIKKTDDPMILTGALKYGGLPALASLAAPGELFVHNTQGTRAKILLEAAYAAAGSRDRLQMVEGRAARERMIDWLLR